MHSFQTLLADLATLARNTITTAITPHYPLTVLTRPTPVSRRRSACWASVVASRSTPPRCFPSTIQALARFTLRSLD